jgi:hypothetical protein
VAFGHGYPPLISNDKLWLIFFTFCAFFPSSISNTSIVSINFRANWDAQNAENGISGLQISNHFLLENAHTHVAFGHYYPPLINNDKLWLMFFTFCAYFPSFISNTSIVSINFRANVDAQTAGNGISGLQISKIVCGSMPPDPPIQPWYVHHTWPSAIAIPL